MPPRPTSRRMGKSPSIPISDPRPTAPSADPWGGTASPRGERPISLAEKIIAMHAEGSRADGSSAVAPGDALFVRAGVRFSHDYVTAMIDAQFRAAFGDEPREREPEPVS